MSQCRDLDPEELLLAGIVRQAISDARQDKDERLKRAVLEFLWSCAPERV